MVPLLGLQEGRRRRSEKRFGVQRGDVFFCEVWSLVGVFDAFVCVCAFLEWRVVGTLSTKGGWAAIGKNMNNQS